MAAAPENILTPWHVPIRNLGVTFALTLLALWAAGAWRGAAGYEMLIVAMGWPHVLLGFIFFLGKMARGEKGARARGAWLTLATLLWWAAHYTWGVAALIYVYFLYHAFRDEVFVYLTTRARHRGPAANVYARAGIIPLLLLLLAISQPSDYRQDLRRAETRAGGTLDDGCLGWHIWQFRPVADSRGHEFYFYMQAPRTAGASGLTARGWKTDGPGAVRVNDKLWPEVTTLDFAPQYEGQPLTPPQESSGVTPVPVGLLGGHRVGQTFTATENNLSGIWLYQYCADGIPDDARIAFHLASPPLLPLEPFWAKLRWALITFLSALLLWQVWRNWHKERELWLYLAIFGGAVIAFQNWLKIVVNEGYAVPMIFQFVVVFHYFSWYVFTFDKMQALAGLAQPPARNLLDSWLARLRVPSQFAGVVALMSLAAMCGVAWYYLGDGPAVLRYGFDYSYFLYILVFHVTFSFQPKT